MKKILFLLLLSVFSQAFLSEYNYLLDEPKEFFYPCFPSQPEISTSLGSTEFKQVILLLTEAKEEIKNAQTDVANSLIIGNPISNQLSCNDKMKKAVKKALEAVKTANDLIDEKAIVLENAFSEEYPGLASGVISELKSESEKIQKQSTNGLSGDLVSLNKKLRDWTASYQEIINKVFENKGILFKQKELIEKTINGLKQLEKENNELSKQSDSKLQGARKEFKKIDSQLLEAISDFDSGEKTLVFDWFDSRESFSEVKQLIDYANQDREQALKKIKSLEKGFIGESNALHEKSVSESEQAILKINELEREATRIENNLDEETSLLERKIDDKLDEGSFSTIKINYNKKTFSGAIGKRIKDKYKYSEELKELFSKIDKNDFLKIETESKAEQLLSLIKNNDDFSEKEKIIQESLKNLNYADEREQEFLYDTITRTEAEIKAEFLEEYGWMQASAEELLSLSLPKKQVDAVKNALDLFTSSNELDLSKSKEFEKASENLNQAMDYVKENTPELISWNLEVEKQEQEIDYVDKTVFQTKITFTNPTSLSTEEKIKTSEKTSDEIVLGDAIQENNFIILNGINAFEQKTIVTEKTTYLPIEEFEQTTITPTITTQPIPEPTPDLSSEFAYYQELLKNKSEIEKTMDAAFAGDSYAQKSSVEYQKTQLLIKEINTLLAPVEKAWQAVNSGKKNSYSKELIQKNLEDARKNLEETTEVIEGFKSKAENEVSLADEKTSDYAIQDKSIIEDAKTALKNGNYLTALTIAKKVSPEKQNSTDYLPLGFAGVALVGGATFLFLKYNNGKKLF
ncbi:hypothetical protein HUU53_01380 [Candidatus Micrarchaeota archaeon]|nr:hypothetical protein [Candidatus Micrarchaeota archaeon]